MGIIDLGWDSYLTYQDFDDVVSTANLQFQTSSSPGEIVMTNENSSTGYLLFKYER